MWNEYSYRAVWTFFGIVLWDWNENWPFPVMWPGLSFANLLAYWMQHFNSIIFQNLKLLSWSSITSTSFVFSNTSQRTSLVAQMVKLLPTMWETWVQSLGWEDPLEKEMATHSSTLAWKIPWTEEPGRLQSMAIQRVRWLRNFTFILLYF